MKRWLGVIALAAAGIVGFVVLRPEPCRPAAEKLKGVWDADRKFELQKAFGAQRDVLTGVQGRLDVFAADWEAAWTKTCAEPDRDTRARLQVCLDGRLAELQALGDVLVRGEEPVIATAPMAAERVAGLEPCGASSRVPPPTGKIARAELAAAQTKLARSEALRRAGKMPDAAAAAADAVTLAESSKDPGVLGEALLVRAELERVTGRTMLAGNTLTDAWAAAEAAKDVPTQARIAVARVILAGTQPAKAAEANEWIAKAEALKPGAPLLAELALATALLRLEQFKPGEAELLARKARAHYELKMQWARRLDATGILAQALTTQGKYPEAIAMAQESVDGRAGMVGPDHPLTQRSRIFLAQTLLEAHEDVRVLAALEPINETQLATMPAASAGAALCARANAKTRLLLLGGRDDAQRCVSLVTTATGPNSEATALAHDALAAAWRLAKEDRKALGENEAATSIYGAARSPKAALAISAHAATLLALGDAKAARTRAREALTMLDTVPAEHAIDPCPALWVFAEAGRRLKATTSVEEARTAVGCLGDHPGRKVELAQAALTFARALGDGDEAVAAYQKAAAIVSPVQLDALDTLASMRRAHPEAACAAAVEALVRARTDAREKAAKDCKLPRIH